MLSSPRPEDSFPSLTSDEITNYLTETVPQILDRHDAEKDKTLLQNIQSLNNVYRNVNSVINNSAPHFRFGARQDENTEKGPDHDAESTRPKIKWITSSHTDSKSVAANDRFPEFQYRGYIDLPASVSRNGCWAVKFDRYDPSGKRFAICGTKVVVLEATDDGNFAPLFIYPKTCFSLEFTYDEDDPTTSLLAIGGDEPVIHIVDCKTGVVRRRIVGPGGGIHSITFHPRHPSILACGSKDQSVQLINIKTGHLIAVFGGANGHRSEVVSVDITTSGSFLVSGGKDHAVRIWSLSSPQLKHAIENSYNYDHPTYRTGRLISDETIFEISRFPPPIQYHHPVFLTYFLHWDIVDCVRFLTDGVALDELFLLSKSVDGCIMLWKPKNPKKWVAGTKDRGHAVDEILQFEYKVTSDTQWWPQFALDPSLTYLTVGSPRGYIYVWNIPDSIDEDKCFQRGKEKTEQWLQESEKSPSDLSIGGGRKSESDNVGKRGGTPTQEGANDGKENRNRNEWGTQGNDIWLKLGRYRAEPAEPLKLKFENKHNAQIESIAFNYGSSRILLALSSTGRLLRWDVSSSSTTVKSGDIDCKRTIVTAKGIPTSDVPGDSGLPTFPCWTHITRSRETPDDNVLRFLPQMPNLTGDEDEDDIDKKWQKILNENFDSFVFADLPLWRSGYFDVLVEAVEPLIRKYQIQEKRLRDDELNKILNSQFSSPVPQKVGKEVKQRQETTVRRLVWAITKLYGADAGVNVLSSICHKLSVTPVIQLEPDCPSQHDRDVYANTYFDWWCSRCRTFTCHHYLNGENPIAPYPPCKFPESIPLPFAYRPCQPQCFKHFILSTPTLMALPRVDFDDGEKEMFELGVKHYAVDIVKIDKNGQEMRQKDYSCSIAGMVDGRSCWEMYQYFIQNGYHSSQNVESSVQSSSPIISKTSTERKCDINDIHDSLSQYSMEIDQDVEEIAQSSGEVVLSDSEEVDIKITQVFANEAKIESKLKTGDVDMYSFPEEEKDDNAKGNSSSNKRKKKTKTKAKKRAKPHPHESSLPAYIPCAHPGTCESSGMCNCVERNHKCTEYCHCPLNCKNRYEGCSCKECDADCSCIRSNRECGKYCRCVKDMLGCCRNMALQMGLAKRVYIDVSTLPNAGYGLFVDENVKKNEFVGEYIGEKISTTEGDRREKLNAAYLFGLNEDYLIDASTQGGMFRFANDGNEKLNNIQPLIMLAGGEHRIGFYAKREIKKGEELFFDYGPHFKRTLLNSSSSASKKQSKNNNGYGGKSDKRENKRNGKKELLRVKGLHGTLRY